MQIRTKRDMAVFDLNSLESIFYTEINTMLLVCRPCIASLQPGSRPHVVNKVPASNVFTLVDATLVSRSPLSCPVVYFSPLTAV